MWKKKSFGVCSCCLKPVCLYVQLHPGKNCKYLGDLEIKVLFKSFSLVLDLVLGHVCEKQFQIFSIIPHILFYQQAVFEATERSFRLNSLGNLKNFCSVSFFMYFYLLVCKKNQDKSFLSFVAVWKKAVMFGELPKKMLWYKWLWCKSLEVCREPYPCTSKIRLSSHMQIYLKSNELWGLNV